MNKAQRLEIIEQALAAGPLPIADLSAATGIPYGTLDNYSRSGDLICELVRFRGGRPHWRKIVRGVSRYGAAPWPRGEKPSRYPTSDPYGFLAAYIIIDAIDTVRGLSAATMQEAVEDRRWLRSEVAQELAELIGVDLQWALDEVGL